MKLLTLQGCHFCSSREKIIIFCQTKIDINKRNQSKSDIEKILLEWDNLVLSNLEKKNTNIVKIIFFCEFENWQLCDIFCDKNS